MVGENFRHLMLVVGIMKIIKLVNTRTRLDLDVEKNGYDKQDLPKAKAGPIHFTSSSRL